MLVAKVLERDQGVDAHEEVLGQELLGQEAGAHRVALPVLVRLPQPLAHVGCVKNVVRVHVGLDAGALEKWVLRGPAQSVGLDREA